MLLSLDNPNLLYYSLANLAFLLTKRRKLMRSRTLTELMGCGFLLVSMVLLQPVSGLSQTVTASLSGNVTDASGAAVPQASITATNTATGVQTKTTSGADGSYIFVALSPGVYNLRTERAGFKASVLTGIRLLVDQKAAVNIRLEVGTLQTTVEVQGAAPLVDTTTASVGTVISGEQAVLLPLNLREFGALALLVPGTTTDNGGFASNILGSTFSATTYAANGNRTSSNNYVLDGVDSRNLELGGYSVQPPPDAIQEFKIQTNIYSAAFGRTAGSTINLVTKSGTNEFHGGAYEFLRNDKFDARNFFATGKPAYRRNQFGADIGGPIQKNKTFFFGNYEALREIKGLTLTKTVPTASELQGNFASQLTGQTINLCGAGGPSNLNFDSGQLFDPGTESNITCPTGSAKVGQTILAGTPVPGNIITNINPVAQHVLQLNIWPAPNRAGTPNFINQDPRVRNDNIFLVRVDHTFSTKDQVFTRYLFGQSNIIDDSTSSSGLPGFGDRIYYRGQQVALGWTHTFGPSLLNQATFGFNRGVLNETCEACPRASGTLEAFGVQNLLPPGPLFDGYPFFSMSNFTSTGDSGFRPNVGPDMLEKYGDALTWTHGRHTVVVGADLQFWQVLGRQAPSTPRGQFYFNGQYSSLSGEIAGVKSISDLADFLMGYPYQANDLINYLGINEVGGRWWSFYGQDDFKVNSKLALNIGLRYEYRRMPYDKRDNIVSWIPTGPAFSGPGNALLLTAAPAALNDSFCTDPFYNYLKSATGQCLIATSAQRAQFGLTGYDARTLVHSQNHYWAPRFGIAWRPTNSDKFVIRTGYGMFIDLPINNNLNFGATNPIWGPTIQYTTATGQPPPLTNGVPTTTELVFAGSAGIPPVINQSLNLYAGPNYKFPYVQEWSFGISSQLSNNWGFELNYIGNKGTDLGNLHLFGNQPLPGVGPLQPRRPYPDLNRILWVSSDVNSNYNSLQARLERRMSKNFTLLTSFTWAHGLDSNGGDEGLGPSNPQNDNNLAGDYGRMYTDARRTMVVSGVYALPFGQGQHFLNRGGAINTILGEWQVSGIVTYQSGFPFGMGTSSDYSNTGSFGYRPDRVCNGVGPKTVAEWFDTSCFTTEYEQAALAAGTPVFGNAQRNLLDAPPLHNWDIALLKNFSLSERFKLQFRSEFYNAFNTPHFGNPNGRVGTSTYGRISSTRADPRDIQFALKLLF
jgi:Carboxypeptidase regulatory-like domain